MASRHQGQLIRDVVVLIRLTVIGYLAFMIVTLFVSILFVLTRGDFAIEMSSVARQASAGTLIKPMPATPIIIAIIFRVRGLAVVESPQADQARFQQRDEVSLLAPVPRVADQPPRVFIEKMSPR